MPSTILQIAQDVADDEDLERPDADTMFAAYNEGDVTNRRLVRAITKTAKYLASRYDWQILRREKTFVTVDGEAQADWKPDPDDFLRFVPHSLQDRTRRLPILGPLTAAEWQHHKASVLQVPTPAMYQRGDVTYLANYPQVGATIAYEYITSDVGKDTNGVQVARFSVATDVTFFDDELITLGTIYNYRKAAKMDYAQDEIDFKEMVQNRIKEDGGSRIINMGKGSREGAGELLSNLKNRVIVREASS